MTKVAGLVPTLDEAKATGITLGGIALGIIAANAGLGIAKQKDSYIANSVLVLGGAYGAMKVKHPLLKALCLGAATYGTFQIAGKAIKEVTEPAAPGVPTSGLSGLLPETVKATLRKHIPTFAGVAELAGEEDNMGNPSEDNLSLDDMGMREENMGDVRNLALDDDGMGCSTVGSLAA